jgi:hypothetical protein
MPRPTPAQVAYGTATVVLSTLAMLLLSDAHSGAGVVIIAAVGLVLGTLVAVSAAPAFRRVVARQARSAAAAASSLPRSGGVEPRLSEHSLRR